MNNIQVAEEKCRHARLFFSYRRKEDFCWLDIAVISQQDE